MEDKLKTRIEKGLETPFLDKKPELYEDLQEVWNLWWMLHAGRSRGFSANPIPLSEIYVAFLLFKIYNEQERKDYIAYIYAMESVFFKWLNEKDKGKK